MRGFIFAASIEAIKSITAELHRSTEDPRANRMNYSEATTINNWCLLLLISEKYATFHSSKSKQEEFKNNPHVPNLKISPCSASRRKYCGVHAFCFFLERLHSEISKDRKNQQRRTEELQRNAGGHRWRATRAWTGWSWCSATTETSVFFSRSRRSGTERTAMMKMMMRRRRWRRAEAEAEENGASWAQLVWHQSKSWFSFVVVGRSLDAYLILQTVGGQRRGETRSEAPRRQIYQQAHSALS